LELNFFAQGARNLNPPLVVIIVDYAPLSKVFIFTVWELITEPKARFIIQIVKTSILDRGRYAILSAENRCIKINNFTLER